MKQCKDYGASKPLSEYYKHSSKADGHPNSRKECKKAYQRSRPYYKEYEHQRNQTEKRKTSLYANLKR